MFICYVFFSKFIALKNGNVIYTYTKRKEGGEINKKRKKEFNSIKQRREGGENIKNEERKSVPLYKQLISLNIKKCIKYGGLYPEFIQN